MTQQLVTRATARAITADIEQAIAAVLERHGLDTPRLSTTYGDRYALKLETTPVQEGPNGVNLASPEAQAYLLEARYDSELDPDALGREFNGMVFLGMNPRAKSYPYIVLRVSDGTRRKVRAEFRNNLLRTPATV